MKEIKYTILYCVFVRTFVILFYYGSVTVIKGKIVTVPVSVPQHWSQMLIVCDLFLCPLPPGILC
jgi:hypothetical protein